MASILQDASLKVMMQLTLHPLTTTLLILSLLLALLRPIILDFLLAYLGRPDHFLANTWFGVLYKPDAPVPLVELGRSKNYAEILARGSELYPDSAYKISHFPHEIVILPHKWADVFKNSTPETLSFQQCTYDLLAGDFTGITARDMTLTTLLREDVTRLQDRVMDTVVSEGIKAIDVKIGSCEDWTTITLFPVLTRVINEMSQRIFVGEPLCRDERWLQSIMINTAEVFGSVPTLWRYNSFTRPLAAWRLPGLRNARRHLIEARQLLAPVLDQRLKAIAKPGFKAPPDLMQLVIDNVHDSRGRSLDYHIKVQTDSGRGALFPTSTTCYHVLYYLAKYPAYVEPLRQEIFSLNDFLMDRSTATKLVKLDSFIRECQRWSSLVQIGPMRKALEPLQLPDGTMLPVGTLIALNAQNCVFEHSGLENPYEFDGFRFEKLRTLNGNEHKFQAGSPGPNHVAFGYGLQSCPGRFFAIQEIKVVVSHIIMHYDFKLKCNLVQSSVTRPVGVLSITDPTIDFLFKQRS